MRFKFHILIDLATDSTASACGNDSWVKQVLETGDIFTSVRDDTVVQVTPGTASTLPSAEAELKVEDRSLSEETVKKFQKLDQRFGYINVHPFEIDSSILQFEESPEYLPEAVDSTSHMTTEMSSAPSNSVEGSSTGDFRKKKASTTSYMFQSPRARFIGSGVIHLFREEEEQDQQQEQNAGLGDVVTHNQASAEDSESGSKVLAILAVPGYMSASDLLGFVGKECRENVSHFRMLRSSAPNRYMVLMKFREQACADRFYSTYNRKAFNLMEPETCHVVYVQSIRFHKSKFPEFPYLLDDDFTPLEDFPDNDLTKDGFAVAKERRDSKSRSPSVVLAKPNPPPTRALRELPTCPVCLERMDSSITGLLTIICQHTFHCQCLSKWGDNSCPVCRYSQKKDQRVQLTEPNQCSECGSEENLWICLICGNIGCGRYDEAHAFQHYMASDHVYAMDLESQRVWDYAGDGYVHRLIQNQSDGKLVELPSLNTPSSEAGSRARGSGESAQRDSTGDGRIDSDFVPREKLDNIGMEYTYLLTSQLESQRSYFEDIIAAAADKASSAVVRAENLERNFAEARAKLNQLTVENQLLRNADIEVDKLRKKTATLQGISGKLEKEWREEKAMNQSMLEKLEFLQKEKEERDAEVGELKDQLRDIMLYLDAQQKFQGMEEEVQQGTVVVSSNSSKHKRRGKGKK
ncbi:BRCA1-associated protein 2-domain-containing protein [Lipomyces oligophaga]|uniref:BRCA1-associated protein 2-domain-containing protein n=1 Tax=Lipomyces oligophaga TaxID=45792 RepID=UPI0034CD1871